MASDSIIKKKVVDDILATENKVEFNALVGAQSVTAQEFKAITATPSSMIWNIVVPSLETIVVRRMFMQATLTLEISGTKANTEWLVNHGVTDALAPFPTKKLNHKHHANPNQQ